MSEQQGWFSARLVFESVHPDKDEAPKLFEERIVLLRGRSEEQARARAAEYARSAREEFTNAFGRPVKWIFRDLLDVQPILDESIEDGTEVYSAFLDEDELDNLHRSLVSPPKGY